MTYDWKTAKPPEKAFKARVDSAGRVLLPAEVRKQLGIEPGHHLMMRVTKPGFMEAWTSEYWFRKAQEILRRHVPENVDLVDDFIAWRRQEAAREEEKMREWGGQRVLRETKPNG